MQTTQKIAPGSLFECSGFVFIIICTNQNSVFNIAREQAISVYTACLPKDFKIEVKDIDVQGLIAFADCKILCV
jgi:hypothetical protein